MPSEDVMAKDIRDRLIQLGLDQERFRIYVCSQINKQVTGTTGNAKSKKGLPFYVPKTRECPTDLSRQVGRCDMVVVDIQEKRVWLTVEFKGKAELETGESDDAKPKDLVADYFYIFMASVFKH